VERFAVEGTTGGIPRQSDCPGTDRVEVEAARMEGEGNSVK
jgi:hypothetical protein